MAFSFVSLIVLALAAVLAVGLVIGVVFLARSSAKGIKEGKEVAESDNPLNRD